MKLDLNFMQLGMQFFNKKLIYNLFNNKIYRADN